MQSPGGVAVLRAAWVQDWKASEILSATWEVLGFHPELMWVGYTFDDEGLARKYDDFLRFSKVDLPAFGEYHFKEKAES
jgi:hypothetical protein